MRRGGILLSATLLGLLTLSLASALGAGFLGWAREHGEVLGTWLPAAAITAAVPTLLLRRRQRKPGDNA